MITKYIVLCLSDCMNFEGRAKRGEFNSFAAFSICHFYLPKFVLNNIDFNHLFSRAISDSIYRAFTMLFIGITFVPFASVLCRRFHDLGYSMLRLLLLFVPLVNLILIFKCVFSAGDKGPNRYGPNTNKLEERTPIEDFIIVLRGFLVIIGSWFIIDLINRIAIPYIFKLYNLSAQSIKMEYGIEGFLSALYQASPSTWYHLFVDGIPLPNYKWYIAVLLALMVQIVVFDIESYIDYVTICHDNPYKIALMKAYTSILWTSLMLSFTTIAIITICPQNILLFFMLFELLIICFPCIIHHLLSSKRNEKRNRLSNIPFVIVNTIILIISTKVILGAVLLLLSNLIKELIECQQMNYTTTGKKVKHLLLSFIGLFITSMWITAVVLLFRPYTNSHIPSVKKQKVVEKIAVSSLYTKDYSTIIIRDDGYAVDTSNRIYCDNTEQVTNCKHTNYFLKKDGTVVTCSSPGQPVKIFFNDIVWISSYDETMILIDKEGNVWAYGNMNNYLSEGGYFSNPQVIIEGYHIIKGDVGKKHLLFLDDKRNLYCMGSNSSGELGIGSKDKEVHNIQKIMDHVLDAKAGKGFSYALTDEGNVYVWGKNDVRQLGIYQLTPFTIPLSDIGYTRSEIPFTTEPVLLTFRFQPKTKIKQIAIGDECGFAITESDELWAWGNKVGRKGVTDPFRLRAEIKWVADNKFCNGVLHQECLIITLDDEAYLIQDEMVKHCYSEYSNTVTSIIPNNLSWGPDFVESINSNIELLLNSFGSSSSGSTFPGK